MAEDASMVERLESYAKERGLTYEGRELPGAVPGLTVGELKGEMAGGLRATLELQTNENPALGPDGAAAVTLTAKLDGVAEVLPILLCREDLPGGAWRVGVNRLRTKLRAFEFESIEFDRRFRVETDPEQDEVFVYELFAPTLIDWLAERAPPGFYFAVEKGELMAVCDEIAPTSEMLDRHLEAAAHVAQRVERECGDGAPTD